MALLSPGLGAGGGVRPGAGLRGVDEADPAGRGGRPEAEAAGTGLRPGPPSGTGLRAGSRPGSGLEPGSELPAVAVAAFAGP